MPDRHPRITSQKNKPSTSMTHVACDPKLRSVVGQSGVRSCVMLGLPTHLVQELNVYTVDTSANTLGH